MTRSAALRRRLALSTTTALLLAGAGVLAVATPASAATFEVTSTTDDGAGYTLREAIADANSTPGVDTVTFNASLLNSTITINSVLIITEGLVIDGLGAGNLSVQRSANSDVFAFQPATPGEDFTLEGITVQGNGITTGTGLVVNDNADTPNSVTVNDVRFVDLVVGGIGGAAINLEGISGTLSITDSEFVGNDSSSSGGAIYVDGVDEDVILDQSLFSNNTSPACGGGIYVSHVGVLFAQSSHFEGNSAATGGGICAGLSDEVVISDASSFVDNTATFQGGAALVSTIDELTVAESTFVGNQSGANGGALFVGVVDSFTVRDSAFTENSTASGGGAIGVFRVGATSGIINTVFTGNSSENVGGSVYVAEVDGAELSIVASTFQGSTAGLDGGALAIIDVTNAPESSVSIENSTFAGNGISGDCGCLGTSIAVYDLQGAFTLLNSTIDDGASSGGAFALGFYEVELDGYGVSLLHSTIVGAGGVFIDQGNNGAVEVTHTIVDSVTSETTLAVENPEVGFVFDLSWSILSDAGNPGVNDIEGNQFSVADVKLGALGDNGGPTPTRLPAEDSPAHNAGDPSIVLTDSDYDQRYFDYLRQVQTIDIGAVEIQTIAKPQLAATGTGINPLIPIIGGVLLLGGIAAIVVAQVRRRKFDAPPVAPVAAAPTATPTSAPEAPDEQ